MSQVDIYALLIIICMATLGLMRGFSGEVGAIVKLVFTGLIGYKILDLVGNNLNPDLVKNAFFPTTIYAITFILVSFLAKIFVMPIVYFLRTILPFFIDKPFGFILATVKIMVIITIAYNISGAISKTLNIELPESLEDSYTAVIAEEIVILIAPFFPEGTDIEKKQKDSQKNIINKLMKDPESSGLTGDKLKSLKQIMKHYGKLEELNGESKNEDDNEEDDTPENEEDSQEGIDYEELNKLMETLDNY